MVTIGKLNLRKQSIIGGEALIFPSKITRCLTTCSHLHVFHYDRWKANRVFDQLEVTRYHTGLVLFLEEDHYVAEDFLYLLKLMQKKAFELCSKCNIMSLGTYLKTFNYYTYNSNHKKVS